jgi:hypothetical protein
MKQPPPSAKRRRPLPDHRPNPSADDPAAPARVEAILASPSYREADRDPDFLQIDVLRVGSGRSDEFRHSTVRDGGYGQ